jgi:hypothetical protein
LTIKRMRVGHAFACRAVRDKRKEIAIGNKEMLGGSRRIGKFGKRAIDLNAGSGLDNDKDCDAHPWQANFFSPGAAAAAAAAAAPLFPCSTRGGGIFRSGPDKPKALANSRRAQLSI